MPLPKEIINGLIPQIAKEQNFVNYRSEIKSISSGGANYSTTLYTITISEGDNVLHMFAKVAALGELMRKKANKRYEIEIFFYTKLLKVYERLQDEHQVVPEHRLAVPKFYAFNSTVLEETIVLENLLVNGYQAYDRFKSIDWENSISALSQVAKMHSLAFAYSEYYPEEFNKVLERQKISKNAYENLSGTFKVCLNQAISVAKKESKDKVEKYFKNFETVKFMEYHQYGKRPVLGHGDFRPSNLMHRTKDDGVIDIKILDFQILHGTSPVIDLLYFIFIGSDEQFRTQYYEKLIDHYYTELQAAMKRLHLDPEKVYSKADYEQELKEKLPFGLAIAVLTLPIVTVATENAPQVNDDMRFSDLTIRKTSDLYSERMNGVLNDYIKWGILI